ncbi:MAG: hypothetical protein GX375_00645 [Clostridiales bacterium]|nr:hypothetical protein [Clostridiales bacterium]
MKVRKRNGNLQDLNMDKIRLTLERVSDELKKPFTASDLNLLIGAIEGEIMEAGKEIIDSIDIGKIVIGQLKKNHFMQVAKAYEEFDRKF